MKDVVVGRIMYGLRMFVAVLLALSACTVILPLLVPAGFAGWFHEQVIEQHLRSLGTWADWPMAVRILYLAVWYVYFVADVIVVFEVKRFWKFLMALSILVASTWASWSVLDDALTLPVPH